VNAPATTPRPADPGGGSDGASAGDLAGYVAAVRARLDDLGPDEVEELTGGLQADLADELRHENATPMEKFGPPVRYADELRAAAGLSPRSVRAGRFGSGGGLSGLVLELRQHGHRLTASLTRQPWWPELRDFVISLRPLWWLLRGYVAYQLLDHLLTTANGVLPYSTPTWLAFLGLTAVSMELGRRGWAAGGRAQRWLIGAGNAVALLVLAFALLDSSVAGGAALNTMTANQTEVVVVPPDRGLFSGGYQVVNVFPYDKNGQPLRDVQLFDDRGRPLLPAADSYVGRNGERVRLVPPVTAAGAPGTNVFPLREQILDPGYDPQTGQPATASPGPLLRDAALPDPTHAAVIPLPVPTATGAASATPTPAASSTPSAAATSPAP
jgi:hypothetical protein